MTLPVSGTIQIPVALDETATAHVRTRRCTASEIIVRGSDSGVEHENRRSSSISVALVCTDSVQTPCGCLRCGLDLGNGVNLRIRLDVFGHTLGLLHHFFKLSLGATDLEKRHATTRGVTHGFAVTELAESSQLLVTHTRFDDHCPILLLIFGLGKGFVAFEGKVVVQNGHTRDKL